MNADQLPAKGVLVVADDRMLAHDPGPGHPERPDRLRAIRQELDRSPVGGLCFEVPTPATREMIERVHSPGYLDALLSLRGRSAELDPDTPTSPGSVDAALLAAGAAVLAVTEAVRAAPRPSFALVRPPGHHAERDHAMGFCLLNNVAIAAAHARYALGCERVLVVDWDVHHGNGTQHAFAARSDVLVFNAHRFPFYPGTGDAFEVGDGEGRGFTVNVPLPPALGDGDYEAVFADLLAPIAESFRPDLVLVSAGFDAHRSDPLGGMSVSEEGFAALCGVTLEIARRRCGGRIALVLEGGYDLFGLARSVRSCLSVLGGATPPAFRAPSPAGEAAFAAARSAQRGLWKLLRNVSGERRTLSLQVWKRPRRPIFEAALLVWFPRDAEAFAAGRR